MKDQGFSLREYYKNSSIAPGGVPQAIHVWKNLSISLPTSLVGYLEWVSYSLLRRKRKRRYNSRDRKKQGMRIEEDMLKEVMVKVMVMRKMPEKKDRRKRGRRSVEKRSSFMSSWFNEQSVCVCVWGGHILLYCVNSLVQVTQMYASMELEKCNLFIASIC